MFLEYTGSFTKEVTIQFLQALQSKFGEEPVVVLDTGSYFTANKVREFVEGTERELLCLPTGMAKLDPTEECWRRLRTALGNRYFGSLDELRAGIRSALETIDPPTIYQYLCRQVSSVSSQTPHTEVWLTAERMTTAQIWSESGGESSIPLIGSCVTSPAASSLTSQAESSPSGCGV